MCSHKGPSAIVSVLFGLPCLLYVFVHRQRPQEEHSPEESERRALLLKRWALFKQQEHEMERDAIRSMLEAQQEALEELKLESAELYAEAIKRDTSLFPFEKEGPHYTPPISNYQAPEGRYNDITKVLHTSRIQKIELKTAVLRTCWP